MDDDRPTLHPVLFQLILRISDVALIFAVWMFAQMTFFRPTYFGGPMFDPPVRTFAGLPVGQLLFWLGVSGIVVGWIWIRRIARGEPEPESNDRFWRSRR
jgi:hypothetical protein